MFIIRTMKAHKGVSRDTIGGWIRDKTKLTGIDVSKLSPHLRRAASTRSAHNEGVPIDIVMEKAGWSNTSTAQRFYCKPVQEIWFSDRVLKSVDRKNVSFFAWVLIYMILYIDKFINSDISYDP